MLYKNKLYDLMKKLEIEELLKRFNNIHNYKFDYSLVKYINLDTKIEIICPTHGIFKQTPRNHFNNDCFECSKRKRSKTLEYFINQVTEIHNNFYDYSETIYKNYLTKVKIICPIHGDFYELPNEHIKGSGCKKCGIEKTKKFTVLGEYKCIEKSKNVHGDKYNYSNMKYINSYTKVEIICPKHGSFYQAPQDHIHSKAGCPICKESKGELLVSNILIKNDIYFDRQKSFSELKHKRLLYYDFYLPDYKLCIEYDGEQHFKSIDYWGGDKSFEELKMRDNLKNEYCKDNNISLLRLTYKETESEIEERIINFLNIKNKIII